MVDKNVAGKKAKAAKGPTDFNDLHLEYGLQEVKRQLSEAVECYRAGQSVEATAESVQAYESSSESAPFDMDAPPIEAYSDEPTVRQHLVGVEDDLPAETKALDLAGALQRFMFVVPTGGMWDTQSHSRMKKTALRDYLGADLFKEWLASKDRKDIQEAAIRDIVRQRIEAQRAAENRPDWHDQFQYTDTGHIKSDIANTKLVLDNDVRWKDVLGYCEFSYRIMKRSAPPFELGEAGEWTDTDTDRLRIWLSAEYSFTPKAADALGAVVVTAESNGFHPVQEYLHGLEWDRECRVHAWLHKYLGTKLDEYHQLVGQMFLVSAVARVMQPPVKVDSVLIFEGLQGLGKSTALGILGGEWFTDTPMVLGDKDSFQQMQGVWIIELAELDSFNKAESTRAKQFFGAKSDRYRPSYGRMAKTFHRQCVFTGSTNQESYLKDATGNRRYWPVMCTKVDDETLRKERDQLWAEAYHLYQNGAKWWPQDKHKHLFESEQEQRFDVDVWEELIEKWLIGHTRDTVLSSEIMDEALGMQSAQMKPPEQARVGRVMSHLGWKKCRLGSDGKRQSGYRRPPGWGLDKQPEPESNGAVESF